MRFSELFTKTRKEEPQDEVSKNARLLIRAGYIHKEMAGVYDFLPLGLRTLNKIINIIREEMNAIGAQEVLMSSLQRKELWEKTNRWSDDIVDVWFKTKMKNDSTLGLGFTHEEPVTEMMKNFISSYKDLPRLVYQFQTKFRNETRAKSGIMRTREFIMKDLYSFAKSQKEHEKIYNEVADAYMRIFNRLGIGDRTYKTFASGGVFSKYSHEFQTITDAGEDIIYVSEEKGIAINEEVLTDEVLSDLGVSKDELVEHESSEVGNIFSLGTKYSSALGLSFKDEDGKEQAVIMGSYGIGPARLMGVIVETLSDDKGIVWPTNIAPFQVHLISHMKPDEAEELYKNLQDKGFEVLYDDRDISLGAKLNDADLIGLPFRVLVSEKSLESGGFEFKRRTDDQVFILDEKELIDALNKEFTHE